MATAKVVLSAGEYRFELEGSEEFVEGKFKSLLQWISEPPEPSAARESEEGGENGRSHGGGKTRKTLKTFVTEKSPRNVYEAMAVILHYKRAYEQSEEVSGEEIRKALLQANQHPPKFFNQGLTDARRKYGYLEAGSKRGLWKLSHQGETLVEVDLPRVL
jgi:hypothetical protein